ncbi:hypothetical protein G6F32_014934 [Rhizopus arrhizus]|nr:hypothetical protein G6F32_014934 [Rhizopus arrhizus]
MLPGGDGADACRRLREQGEDIPVILLTARDEAVDRIIGLEAGADDYVGKPFDPRELLARTAGTLGGVLMLVTALALIFAPQLASVFSSGVDTDPVKQGLLVDLFRLTFPFLLFVSLTALAGGALNSFQRFAMPALTPVILNLCMIAGALCRH